MTGIEHEAAVFLQAILAGNLLYLVYTLLRVLRRIVKHNLFWISMEDILFWIGTSIFLFAKIFQTSNGIIRWYFVVGVLTGGTLIHEIIQKIAKKFVAKSKKKE